MQIRQSLYILFTFIFVGNVFANISHRLLSRSTTGRTAVINIGSLDGVSDGDVLILLKNVSQKNDDFVDPATVVVAQGKIVKVLNNRSIWFLYKIFRKDELKVGERFLVTTQSQLLDGRVEPKIQQKKVLVHADKQADYVKDYHHGYDKSRLVKNAENYEKVQTLGQVKKEMDQDFEIIDIGQWEGFKDDLWKKMEQDAFSSSKFTGNPIYNGPSRSEFMAKKDLDTYEKLMVNYLLKVNSPGFSYETLYYNKAESPDSLLANQKPLTLNSIEQAKIDAQNKKIADREYYRKLLANGEAWSDEYSDEDLAQIIYEKGILDEQERRQLVISRRHSYELFLNTGMNFVNNETPADPSNSQQYKVSLGASLEYNLAKRYSFLESFTSEVEMRVSNDGYAIVDTNAKSFEFSFAGSLNWYPYLPPNSVEQNLFFIGVGFRYGRSKLTVENVGEEGLYALSSFPSIRLGVKYNFRNKFGLRLMTSFETLNLSRIERNVVNILPENLSATDVRLTASVAYYF